MASAVPFVNSHNAHDLLLGRQSLAPERLKRGEAVSFAMMETNPARSARAEICFDKVVLGGCDVSATEFSLMFAFYAFGYTGMQ